MASEIWNNPLIHAYYVKTNGILRVVCGNPGLYINRTPISQFRKILEGTLDVGKTPCSTCKKSVEDHGWALENKT